MAEGFDQLFRVTSLIKVGLFGNTCHETVARPNEAYRTHPLAPTDHSEVNLNVTTRYNHTRTLRLSIVRLTNFFDQLFRKSWLIGTRAPPTRRAQEPIAPYNVHRSPEPNYAAIFRRPTLPTHSLSTPLLTNN